MANVMKMDRIVDELGIDLNGDALLLRAEQLVKTEEQSLGKRTVEVRTVSTLTYRLYAAVYVGDQ